MKKWTGGGAAGGGAGEKIRNLIPSHGGTFFPLICSCSNVKIHFKFLSYSSTIAIVLQEKDVDLSTSTTY